MNPSATVVDQGVLEHPEVREFEFGERPEDTALQHIDRIKQALEWHGQHWSPALDALGQSGLMLDAATRLVEPTTGRFAEIDRLLDTANTVVRPAAAARLRQFELADIRAVFDQAIGVLEQIPTERDLSGLARVMASAVAERDVEAYNTAHDRLARLHRQKERVARRKSLLARLRSSAADWARSIEQRDAPHDADTPPGPPDRAWLCRQLLQELSRRAAVDIAALQRQVSQMRTLLHRKTEQLVDRLAWATQHDRTGRREQQSLQGWLQTVSTPGYQSGKRSSQLKAQARRLLAESRDAVPVWIMTIGRAIETLDFQGQEFDVVIVDEASQCDMLGLLLLGLAKSAIVMGDDKQVSPSAVGERLDYTQKLIDEYLQGLRTRELFTGRFSLYDFATQSFGKPHRLIEHFRCAEPIIQFSNHLSYNGEIRPLRDTSRVQRLPHIVEHQVAEGRRERDSNEPEAIEVASLVMACMEQPEYEGATFGVVSMLRDRHALEIDSILRTHLSEARYEAARLICGTPPQFQGDERDVIFLSMVDSSDVGPLRLMRTADAEKRYNVAASRAKDQLWIVHSIDDQDLKEGDLRLRLLRHARDPAAATGQRQRIEREADSEFERLVGTALTDRGYRIRPQWPVGSMRIELVAIGRGDRKVAIECDGEKYHGLEHLAADLERQQVLERLGCPSACGQRPIALGSVRIAEWHSVLCTPSTPAAFHISVCNELHYYALPAIGLDTRAI